MIGQTISHYMILEKLGEGGMGVVYRAHDTKLDRDVALKFLPLELTKDRDARERFIHEAKAASALNHPNVCTIHDIQEHDNQMFIVMEFVDGQTLREKKESISFKHAIDIGIQIADGLAAAHEKGIVHRDIKPENIMVRKDGIVQIMDFGLAKLRGTVTRLTKDGSTVGTVAYMSPEQVQGQEADHRSDIFSLGILLYELFSGQLPFRGVHETALMYEIVNVDPSPMSSVKPDIDPELDRIVFECLQKEPDERYQAVKDVSKDLKRFKRESSRQRASKVFTARPVTTQVTVPPAARFVDRLRREYLVWSIAAILAVTTIILLIGRLTISPEARHPIYSFIVPPESVYIHSFGNGAGPPVISPDGQNIVYVGLTPAGITKLFVYSLGTGSTRSLDGTEGAYYPFWSPDGKSLGFFTGYFKLRKVDVSGGSPITIYEGINNPRGGSWSKDNTILFGMAFDDPVQRVSADGGVAEHVTRLDSTRKEGSHRWPIFLPDGQHFLYFARTFSEAEQAEGDAVFVGSLDGKMKKLLVYTSSNVVYASGYLFFIRGSALMAQQFDISSLELKGEAVQIANKVINDPGFNLASFFVSNNGILIYQLGDMSAGAPLSIFGQDGKLISQIGEGLEHTYPRFSPDGERISVGVFDTKTRREKIWNYDLKSGARSKITSGSDMNYYPVWSPDGSRILFMSRRDTIVGTYMQVIGRGEETRTFFPPGYQVPLDWSLDNKKILVTRFTASRQTGDLWIVPADSGGTGQLFVGTEFDESDGRFSPDGKWIAYSSNETGDYEIYIKSTQSKSERSWRISTSGGSLPRWGRSGNELFFGTKDNKIASATLRFSGSRVEVTGIHPLFSAPVFVSDYDFSPKKNLFVFCQYIVPQKSSAINLVVNWDAGLKK
jgi:eukaryotic-like serine/threonine-protein kinase